MQSYKVTLTYDADQRRYRVTGYHAVVSRPSGITTWARDGVSVEVETLAEAMRVIEQTSAVGERP